MRRRLTPLALLVACLALPASAHAAFFPAEVVDGPNADVVSVGEVDVSRDATSAVSYLRREGGIDHVFVSLQVGGVFLAPVRVDAGQGLPSSSPVVATSDQGRYAAAWINGGNLYAAVLPRRARAWSAPILIAAGGVSNPSIDMSVNGVTYLSFTQGGDVKVARASRDAAAFTVLDPVVDADPARQAGVGEGRSRIVAAADGTGLVAWGEEGADGRMHVHTRRLFELRVSVAGRDLTLDSFDGAPAGKADLPELDIEDDSSFAQVVFRQQTAAGPRTVMRRLRGSDYEEPFATAKGVAGVRAHVDLTGRGEGLVATESGTNEVFGSTLWNNAFNSVTRYDTGSGLSTTPVASIGENEDGVIAWLQGTTAADATIVARHVDNVEKPVVGAPAVLSRPEFGPVDPAAGFSAASSRRGDVVVAFVQGLGAGRRLVVGLYDVVPARPVGYTTTNPRAHRVLRWGPSVNLLGRVSYEVFVDGRRIGRTTRTRLGVNRRMLGRKGTRMWRIVATDRRGQKSTSRNRILRVDYPKRRR